MKRVALWKLAFAAIVVLVVAVLLGRARPSLVHAVPADIAARAAAAEETMKRAEQVIAVERRAEGIESEAGDRTAASSLVGAEITPLTTTVGNIEAKRVAVSPAWARELVLRLHHAGLRKGDFVAAGFSGSFPGLNLAVCIACQALQVDVAAVSSVTASSWGANQPGFTWPQIEMRLVKARLIARASVAVSTGGDGDRALDLEPEGRADAERIARLVATEADIKLLAPRSFEQAIAERMAVYRSASGGRAISLYVNVGGTEPSLGRSPGVLRLRSGFLPPVSFDLSPNRGIMARFAERGVPVLTLLNVRDLALRWGIL